MTQGAAIVASEVAKAVKLLKRAGVPVPASGGPLEIARAAQAWEKARASAHVGIQCAVSVLEAAAACGEGDLLAAGFVLGQRVAGMEWALGGVLGELAAARSQIRAVKEGRRKAGAGMKRVGRDDAMNRYGNRALDLAGQIVEDGSRRSIEAVIDELRNRWPDGGSDLPESNRAIRALIGADISAMLRPRLPGRRKRVA